MTDPIGTMNRDGLVQARLGLLSGTAGLVRFVATFPEASVEREVVRHALQETTNALKRIYSPAVAEAAHRHALRTLEIPAPADARVPISGRTLELYAEELVKHLFACEED